MTMMCMAALFLMAVSCKKEKANETYSGEGFRATTESHTGDGDSKTQLNSDLSVTWCDGDIIKVFNSTGSDGKFSAAGAGTTADFIPDPEEGITDAFFTPSYTAFYPYGSATGTNQISLEETQHYTVTDDDVLTFASGENPMAAKSSNKVLPFKNLCGILKFQLYSESPYPCTVKSLRVTSLKSGEQLWGTGTVTFDGTNATLGTLTGGTGSITLDCGEGVNLSTSEGAPTEFMFVIPDGALSEGFTVTVTDAENKVWSKTTTANNMIKKSKIKAMPPTEVGTHDPVSPSEVTITDGCVSCTNTIRGSVSVPTGGPYTCEYGIVYCPTSAGHNPTIADSKIIVKTESITSTKNFTADLGALEIDVEYKVCTYAMIDDIVYSTNIVTVIGGDMPQPLPSNWKNGKNPYPFTVGNGKVVHFSQGNLQYIGSAATPYWKFADHQFDLFGYNGQESASETADRDLFGWGTSGINPNPDPTHPVDQYYIYYQPWATLQPTNVAPVNVNWYGYGPSLSRPHPNANGEDERNLLLSNGSDWGANAISNGGNQPRKWRTPTKDEWNYLIYSRPDASNRYGLGKLGGCTPGLIILPDQGSWTAPADVPAFKPGVTTWANNSYTYPQWAKMEAAGAVFLPVAGARNGTTLFNVGARVVYWSSTVNNAWDCSYNSFGLYFYENFINPVFGDNVRNFGLCVRLVSDD